MDRENQSNTGGESLPEKVDVYVGMPADSAMIERVMPQSGRHEQGGLHGSDSDDGSDASAGASRPFGESRPGHGSEDEEEFKIPERFSKNGRRKAVSFPLKLMKILSTKGNEDIIAWLPGGKSFTIANQERFTTKILPKHFKQSKYTSFTRKLLRWGFTRIKAGTYTHELFQKGRIDLVEQMSCKSKVSAPPLAFAHMGGFQGFPSTMSQFPSIRQQQMAMGSAMGGVGGGMGPSSMPQDTSFSQFRHQDALNAVDREINRVRRLLQEKRLEAATLPPVHHQLQNPSEHMQAPSRLGGMGQLGMNQPQGGLGSLGGMQQAQPQPGVASLPTHAESATQSQMQSSFNPVDIEMEVRRRLHLREQGLNMGIDSSSLSSLRDPSLNRAGGIDPSYVASLREQGLNRGMEASSMAASLQRGMMPLSPQQQPQQMLGGQWNMSATGDVGGGGGGGVGGGLNPNLGFAGMGGTMLPTGELRGHTGTTPPPTAP